MEKTFLCFGINILRNVQWWHVHRLMDMCSPSRSWLWSLQMLHHCPADLWEACWTPKETLPVAAKEQLCKGLLWGEGKHRERFTVMLAALRLCEMWCDDVVRNLSMQQRCGLYERLQTIKRQSVYNILQNWGWQIRVPKHWCHAANPLTGSVFVQYTPNYFVTF